MLAELGEHPMRRTAIFSAISAVAVAAVVGALAATHRFPFEPASAATPAVPTAPVVAGTVTSHEVPIYLQGVGTVIAYNTVIVRSQIQGQITKINFSEGQAVKSGDLLAVIDPRPYQAQLDQATANRSRDEASAHECRGQSQTLHDIGQSGLGYAAAGRDPDRAGRATQRRDQGRRGGDRMGADATQLHAAHLAHRRRHRHTTDRYREHHPSHRPEWPRRGHAARADLDDLHAAGDEPAADSTAPSQWSAQSRGLQSGQHNEAR